MGAAITNRLKLIYRENPATGLPRLEDPDNVLESADLFLLEQEIKQRYQHLLVSQERVLSLEAIHNPNLPRWYRVEVEGHGEKRCPTVVLYGLSTEEVKELEDLARLFIGIDVLDQVSWPVQFFQELADLLATGVPSPGRAALNYVMSDLRNVWRKNPRTFTLLLLLGYLHTGDAFSRAQGVPDNKYAEAAQLLHQVAGEKLPPEMFHFLLSDVEDEA